MLPDDPLLEELHHSIGIDLVASVVGMDGVGEQVNTGLCLEGIVKDLREINVRDSMVYTALRMRFRHPPAMHRTYLRPRRTFL